MAYQFSQEGYKTVLLDKRDVALGSTSATTALLQYEIDEPLHLLIDKVGRDAAVDTYTGGVKAIENLERIINSLGLQCEFCRKASLYIAHNESEKDKLMRELECREQAGIKVKWKSKAELARDFNLLSPGGILSEAAASVDGYRLAHELLAFSTKHHNLQVYDHTEVASVHYNERHSNVYTTELQAITCQRIIYATGYESQQLLNDKIVDLISTYACVSEPLDNLPSVFEQAVVWNTEDPYLYVRGTGDNRILIGGADEPFVDPEKRDELIDKKETNLIAKYKTIMPGIDITADFAWAGTFGVTKDALPYIGPHPDFPNSYFVLGFGGNGITFSVMGMQILSDAVAGRKNKFLDYFRFGR